MNSYSPLLFLSLLLVFQSCASQRTLSEQQAELIIQESASSHLKNTGNPAIVVAQQKNGRIQPGDEITLFVFGYEEFDTETLVSAQGTIVLPLAGEISVSGLTKEEFEARIRHELRSYIREEITLTTSIRNRKNEMVSVLGSVRDPANYPIIGEASLFEVISMAGGTAETADLRNIRVYRTNSPTVETIVDIPQHLENGTLSDASLVIQPGDIILVPSKDNMVRELSFFLRDMVLLFGLFSTFR